MMEEQVTPFSFDKPKAPVRNDLLHRTLWHLCTPQKQTLDARLASQDRPSSLKQKADSPKCQTGASRKAPLRRLGQEEKNDKRIPNYILSLLVTTVRDNDIIPELPRKTMDRVAIQAFEDKALLLIDAPLETPVGLPDR